MGASRKLQGEIDRVLKKVQEGVDVFDSIWKKVYDTDNANQKEKFEADLKKEIKKLQRYRDQIKTWIQSSEIKDKKALMDARKLIEREMERFKICEKETKTKAFSKEGLEQQPKTDPKEKAKSETRDWLNNVVGELESQIDTFEAELEGLTVKKGKTRPPRLTHLEASILRHKAHIMKLELVLRLLDNDELSPEQVNDAKDFLDDYVERNQESFDEFSDVDDLYSSLPLEVESLEEIVVTGPPALVKGVGVTSTLSSLKTSLTSPTAQQSATVTSPVQRSASAREQAEETPFQDNSAEVVPRTPPAKSSPVGSFAPTSLGVQGVNATINAPSSNVDGASVTSAASSGTISIPSVLDDAAAASSPSPVNRITTVKDEENTAFSARKSSPAVSESGLRGAARVPPTNQTYTGNPLSSGIAMPSSGALGIVSSASETPKRSMFGTDERLGESEVVQSLVSPRVGKTVFSQAAKTTDVTGSGDNDNIGEVAAMAGRAFSPSVGPGVPWRPGSPFQSQSEVGQFRQRTEITPDQREKFLQKFQQVQQGQGNPLSIASLGGGNHKQFSAQQNPLLQQFNCQSSSGMSHVGLGPGVQAPGFNTIGSSLQQANSIHQQQSALQALLSAGPKDAEVGRAKVGDTQQQQNLSENAIAEPVPSSGLNKNLDSEEDSKANYPLESSAGVSGSLTGTVQLPMDTDLSPGLPLQPNQPSAGLGVIGRKSVSDLGTIGDNLGGPSASYEGMHDQLYNLQMLEAASYKLPQPKDSERARSYTPRHPAATPPSYPQAQAPILNNAAFWERIGSDSNAIDNLFFAFYYQQNTYQQYLAAKELKKQSWRYHRKYNTWFQRHEEPKVTTDEFEQGTYVYFDFHITNDDMQHGWCQRIKTQFTFEYNYLEDELTE